MDASFGRIFNAVTPDADAATLVNALGSSLDSLEIMEILAASDELLSEQIAQTKSRIEETKNGLTQNCGAGIEAELCTKETAAARSIIFEEKSGVRNEYLRLKSFLALEVSRLEQEGPMAIPVVEKLKGVQAGLK
jgi:hypothetical protein